MLAKLYHLCKYLVAAALQGNFCKYICPSSYIIQRALVVWWLPATGPSRRRIGGGSGVTEADG